MGGTDRPEFPEILIEMKWPVLMPFALVAVAGAGDVSELLEPIRSQFQLPALAAASVSAGNPVDSGVCGLRRAGGEERATINDRWHLGSCGKSMTASVAAMLVEQHVMRWESTIGESFPALNGMKDTWKAVSLELLFGHRAGTPHTAPPALWGEAWRRQGTPRDQRMVFVRELLGMDPEPKPGTEYIYSNQGYAIAGVMMEEATRTPWETLMQEKLFTPLDLKSAGFGSPGEGAAAGKAIEPWGHRGDAGARIPIPPGPGADNPPAIAPVGTIYMSIGDFARYAGWHADEARNGGRHLTAASFQKLHRPLEGQDYALGWSVVKRPWARGRTLTHSGSNTMNFAVMWVAPEINFAVVAATNVAGVEAEKGCDMAVAALLAKWEKARK